jgi:D-alanine-D-alanine ligase
MWKWQPITFESMHAVVEEVAASSGEYTPVVLNYCDGEEMPDYPGTCVIELLEAKGIVFTGAGSAFSRFCSSKVLEKRAFVEASVPTSPYEFISDINQFCLLNHLI